MAVKVTAGELTRSLSPFQLKVTLSSSILQNGTRHKSQRTNIFCSYCVFCYESNWGAWKLSVQQSLFGLHFLKCSRSRFWSAQHPQWNPGFLKETHLPLGYLCNRQLLKQHLHPAHRNLSESRTTSFGTEGGPECFRKANPAACLHHCSLSLSCCLYLQPRQRGFILSSEEHLSFVQHLQ